MKVSLKLQDHHHHKNHHSPPLLLRAKIPITILNLPFLSHFSTTTAHPSDLALSLSTNFPSFPSFKVTYATAAAPSPAAAPPLSLTLKSGTGVFGSPKSSPLVISAHFSFNPSNPSNPNPTFSLFFKPQLGSFSLRKSTFSHPQSTDSTNGDAVSDSSSFGFVPLESPETVKDLSVESNGKHSIFNGIQLAARTHMPVAKSVALNFRWWMNFSGDQMPVLRINKIGIERVDDASKKVEKKEGELEAVKGMCFWMKRELDVLTRVNREMKCQLEEMRVAHSRHVRGGELKEGVGKKAMPSIGSSSSSGLKQRRGTRNEDNGNGDETREEKKKGNLAIDVESELQRAIAAAAASSS